MRPKIFHIICAVLFIVAICADVIAQQVPNDNATPEEIARVLAKAGALYPRLEELKKLPAHRTASGHILFGWPMQAAPDYDNIPNYYVINNYWDQTSTSSLVDWRCGDRTYEGHNGVDISLWPFHWRMKNNGSVYAVAAAPGIVLDVVEDQFDERCAKQDYTANSVSIMHADGSISMYLHVKTNSVIVNEDDIVLEGQALALIASSGRSTNPHLHFQVLDNLAHPIEPFKDTGGNNCNAMNSDTWWENQKPYWEPQVNRVATHYGHPVFNSPDPDASDYWCPEYEEPKLKNNFLPNDSIYFYAYIHDMEANDDYTIQVFEPDGTTFLNVNGSNGGSQTEKRYYYVPRKIPSVPQLGTWKVVVTYRSKFYTHYFTVGCTDHFDMTVLNGSYGRIAGSYITSTDIMDSNDKVLLQAGDYLLFKPGFHAQSGAELKARVKSCSYVD